MKDEEFEKRLETILSNLYKIDHEVREYLKSQKTKTGDYDHKPYLKKRDIPRDERYCPS